MLKHLEKLLYACLIVVIPSITWGKIYCHSMSFITPTPRTNTCTFNDFDNVLGPYAPETDLFFNKQACNMKSVLDPLNTITLITRNSSQAIFLEDDWESEYTKTSIDCETGGDTLCIASGSDMCHGSFVPGECISGTCKSNTSISCTSDLNCTENVFSCYTKKSGDSADGDTNDMGIYKTGIVHQLRIQNNEFENTPATTTKVLVLTGGELYLRSISAGSFFYKNYPVSFRMPCYGEVYYISMTDSNIDQIQNDSSFSGSPKGRKLSCPKSAKKGEIITLNNTDRSTGVVNSWPENFCGEVEATHEINQNETNFKSGFYSGLIFSCDMENYNGVVANKSSAINDNDWIVFPENENYTTSPETLTILDNRFIRSNQARSFYKFQSDLIGHLLGADSTGIIYGGLITEQNDLTTWFPETLSDSTPTNWVNFFCSSTRI